MELYKATQKVDKFEMIQADFDYAVVGGGTKASKKVKGKAKAKTKSVAKGKGGKKADDSDSLDDFIDDDES